MARQRLEQRTRKADMVSDPWGNYRHPHSNERGWGRPATDVLEGSPNMHLQSLRVTFQDSCQDGEGKRTPEFPGVPAASCRWGHALL